MQYVSNPINMLINYVKDTLYNFLLISSNALCCAIEESTVQLLQLTQYKRRTLFYTEVVNFILHILIENIKNNIDISHMIPKFPPFIKK